VAKMPRRKKRSLSERLVHLYQLFHHPLPNLSFLLRHEEVQNAEELLRVGQAAGVPRTVHVELYVSTRGGLDTQQSPHHRLSVH
jgi:hypothetical protein